MVQRPGVGPPAAPRLGQRGAQQAHRPGDVQLRSSSRPHRLSAAGAAVVSTGRWTGPEAPIRRERGGARSCGRARHRTSRGPRADAPSAQVAGGGERARRRTENAWGQGRACYARRCATR
jgi:hypothetical protein